MKIDRCSYLEDNKKPDLDDLIRDLEKILNEYKMFRSKYEKAILKPFSIGFNGSLIEFMDEYTVENYSNMIDRIQQYYWLRWKE